MAQSELKPTPVFDLACELGKTQNNAVDVPSGGVAKGDLIASGGKVGFVFFDAPRTVPGSSEKAPHVIEKDTEQVLMIYRAPIVRAKKATGTGSEIDPDVRLYYDSTNKVVTPNDGGGANTLVGYTRKPATAADETVQMEFNGAIYDA